MKNKIKNKIMITFIVVLIFLWTSNCQSSSFSFIKNKGRVDNYNVKINTTIDGKLNMSYHIEIIPYENIDKLTLNILNKNYKLIEKSTNIKEIRNSDLYNKIDIILDKNYKSSEKIILNFKILQSNVYELTKNNEICMYRITAGKIDKLDMDLATIYWEKDKVYFSGLAKEQNGSFVYTQNLNSLYKKPLVIQYYSGNFDLKESTKKKFQISDILSSSYLYFIILGIIVITEFTTSSRLIKNDLYLYK